MNALRGRLALAFALPAAAIGAAASLCLTPLPPGAPTPGPEGLFATALVAGLAAALFLPALVPPAPAGPWLASFALAGAACLPGLVAGARLSFAPDAVAFLGGVWLLAAWIASSGAAALLTRGSRRPVAHHQALILAACLLPPTLDFAALETLGAGRLLAGASPLERILDLPDPPAFPAALLAPALVALAGAAALLAARLVPRRAPETPA